METALKDKQNKIESLYHEIEVHKSQIAELREHNKGIFSTIDKKVTGEQMRLIEQDKRIQELQQELALVKYHNSNLELGNQDQISILRQEHLGQMTEHLLRNQNLTREVEDKDTLIQKLNTLNETLKQQKDILEQNLADEKAKSAKMLDKLQYSKGELENAVKVIDKLKSDLKQAKTDKKTLASKNKSKSNVIMQQESQLQQKQE